jgi:membrane-associated phospholipid phosphatase
MGIRTALLPFSAAAALVALVEAGMTRTFDEDLERRVQGAVGRDGRHLTHFASMTGYPPWSRVGPVLAIAAATRLGGPREGLVQAAAWCAAGSGLVLKRGVRRPRPDDPVRRLISPKARGSSFPSTHVLTYVACYGHLARTAHRRGRNVVTRWLLPSAIVGMAVLVSLDRIAEGEHWPTDVMASALFGLGALAVLDALERATAPSAEIPVEDFVDAAGHDPATVRREVGAG